MKTIRIPVTRELASDLAANLGLAVRMDLGEVVAGWWIIRGLDCQPGTNWLHAVLEEVEENDL